MKLTIIMCSILFWGCYTKQKAQTQTYKALNKFPEVIADIARTQFPCDSIGTDSTEFKKSIANYQNIIKHADSIMNAQAGQNKSLDSLVDQLRLDSLTSINCAAMAQVCARISRENSELKGTVRQLSSAIANIKPIKEVQIDRASEFAARDSMMKELQRRMNCEADYAAEKKLRKELQDRVKGKVLIPWWILAGLGVGVILAIVLKLRGKVR